MTGNIILDQEYDSSPFPRVFLREDADDNPQAADQEFFAMLVFGEKNRLRRCRETVPNILYKLNAFSNAEFKDVGQGNFSHEQKLTCPP